MLVPALIYFNPLINNSQLKLIKDKAKLWKYFNPLINNSQLKRLFVWKINSADFNPLINNSQLKRHFFLLMQTFETLTH